SSAQQSQSQQAQQQASASASAASGGAATAGQSSANQDQPDMRGQLTEAASADSRGEQADQDSSQSKLKFENEPWFAKLPPELRSAIQSKARGKAPRGYEERLRRYFESVD